MLYLDCFKPTSDKSIEAIGFGNDINMSSIYTKLIKEAGRYCDNYASDLLIDIEVINDNIKQKQSTVQYIAFRDMGVDGYDYIKNRSQLDLAIYHAVYRLEIKCDEDRVTATLQKVYYNHGDHEYKKRLEEQK